MQNVMPLILLLSMQNKNGFTEIKNAINTAESISSKISTFSSILPMLKNIDLGSLLSQTGLTMPKEFTTATGTGEAANTVFTKTQNEAAPEFRYIDTLSEVISRAAAASKAL